MVKEETTGNLEDLYMLSFFTLMWYYKQGYFGVDGSGIYGTCLMIS